MAKKAAELEKELKMWRETAEEQAEKLRAVAMEDDKLFSHSYLKAAMEKELAWLKSEEKWSKDSRATSEWEIARLKKALAKAIEDNKKLCEAHDVEYRVGMTQHWEDTLKSWERRIRMENEDLKREVSHLEGELVERNKYIAYLRSVLHDQIYEGAEGYSPNALEKEEKSGRRGRPSVTDDAARKRIRKMKKDGFTVRRIAEIERVSPATVQKIVGAKRNQEDKRKSQ